LCNTFNCVRTGQLFQTASRHTRWSTSLGVWWVWQTSGWQTMANEWQTSGWQTMANEWHTSGRQTSECGKRDKTPAPSPPDELYTVCMCVQVCGRAHMFVCVKSWEGAWQQLQRPTHLYIRTHTRIHVNLYAHTTHAGLHIRMHVYATMHDHIELTRAYKHTCTHTHTHTHTHTRTHTHTHTQACALHGR